MGVIVRQKRKGGSWKVYKYIKQLKPDTIIATMAVIIALASLYVACNQVKEARKQTEVMLKYYRLSTKPKIEFMTERRWQLNKDVGIYITNAGLGPAIIKNITVELNGKIMMQLTKKFFQSC